MANQHAGEGVPANGDTQENGVVKEPGFMEMFNQATKAVRDSYAVEETTKVAEEAKFRQYDNAIAELDGLRIEHRTSTEISRSASSGFTQALRDLGRLLVREADRRDTPVVLTVAVAPVEDAAPAG